MIQKPSVLVVDDESGILDTLRILLRNEGFEVTTAQGGKAGLEQIRTGNHDVVLTDVRMPDMDGLTLFEEIKRRWPERAGRVVFVTGDTLSETLRELADAGRCAILEKPFAPDDVRRVVTEVARTSEYVLRSARRGG